MITLHNINYNTGMKNLYPIIIFLFVILKPAFSQTVEKPNYALKNHETLEVLKVEVNQENTVVYLSIENKIADGTFCADKNIYIISQDGERLKLIESSGIPVCPESYKFKYPGEKLSFTLAFPPIKADVKWIDIIEDCNDNCFWFYGITLDNELNMKLDEAFNQASKGKPEENMTLFSTILQDIDNQNLGIEGLLYINIINAAVENADEVNARVWYKRLASSQAPRVKQYINYLNNRGIKY